MDRKNKFWLIFASICFLPLVAYLLITASEVREAGEISSLRTSDSLINGLGLVHTASMAENSLFVSSPVEPTLSRPVRQLPLISDDRQLRLDLEVNPR